MPKLRASAALSMLLVAPGASPAPAAEARSLVAEALDRALSGGWGQLRIEAECRVEGRLPRAEVFGSGVGIWNRETQFTLPREAVRLLLVELRDSGFASMPSSYGGDPDEATPEEEPQQLTCRVGLQLDGASRLVVQLLGGRQSSELRRLAEHILDACRGRAAAGIAALDLDDGLAKVAAGTLAPEVLQVLLSRRPERAPPNGWVLRVDGRTARMEWPGAEAASAEARLDAVETTALARLLREEGVARLPVNLYADELTDLAVRVLRHERKVQARRFARMSPTTHGEEQARFDTVLKALLDCRERWFGPGAAASRP